MVRRERLTRRRDMLKNRFLSSCLEQRTSDEYELLARYFSIRIATRTVSNTISSVAISARFSCAIDFGCEN